MIARRLSAKLTALRRLGLLRNTPRAEVSASIRAGILICGNAGERTARAVDDRAAVEREVDGLAEAWVVAEHPSCRVKREHPQGKAAPDKESRAVDSVIRDDPETRIDIDPGSRVAPVSLAAVDASDDLLWPICAKVDVEAVDVVRPLPAVETVPSEHDPLTGAVLRDVVGAGGREGADAFRVRGKGRRHRAEVGRRRPVQKVRCGSVELDDELVAPRDDAFRFAPLAGEHLGRSEDVTGVLRAGGGDLR